MEKIWLKSYPPQVPAEIDPSRLRTLKELVETTCAQHPDRVAFIQMGAKLSYRRLEKLSRGFAAWLQQAGFGKGDRLAVMLPNTLQYPIALFGALRAGLTVVNTNPLYTAPELQHQLSDSGATAIVVLENFAHVVEKVLPNTQLKRVLVTGVGDYLGFPKSLIVNGRRLVQSGCDPRPRAAARARRSDFRRSRVPAVHRRHDRDRQGGDAVPRQRQHQCPSGGGVARGHVRRVP
jgi:long-chain acyl-CoA synthetase